MKSSSARNRSVNDLMNAASGCGPASNIAVDLRTIRGADDTADRTASDPSQRAVELDRSFQQLIAAGNTAFAAGDDIKAKNFYREALAAAVSLFVLARTSGDQPTTFTASLLAPMTHTIACHNAALVHRHEGDRDCALSFQLMALQQLVAEAECVSTPLFLRVNCVRHMRFALASLVEDLGEGWAGSAQLQHLHPSLLLDRTEAAVQAVAKVSYALARMQTGATIPGHAELDEPISARAVNVLLTRGSCDLVPLIQATRRLIEGVTGPKQC